MYQKLPTVIAYTQHRVCINYENYYTVKQLKEDIASIPDDAIFQYIIDGNKEYTICFREIHSKKETTQ